MDLLVFSSSGHLLAAPAADIERLMPYSGSEDPRGVVDLAADVDGGRTSPGGTSRLIVVRSWGQPAQSSPRIAVEEVIELRQVPKADILPLPSFMRAAFCRRYVFGVARFVGGELVTLLDLFRLAGSEQQRPPRPPAAQGV